METRRNSYTQQEIDDINLATGTGKTITLTAEQAIVLRAFTGSMSLHRMERAADVKRNSDGFLATKSDERAFNEVCRTMIVIGQIHQQLKRSV